MRATDSKAAPPQSALKQFCAPPPKSGAPRAAVIVPLADNDTAWQNLAPLAGYLPNNWPLLFAGGPPPAQLPDGAEWLQCPTSGRAARMNYAARAATAAAVENGAPPYSHFWFVHADSRIAPNAVNNLNNAIAAHPRDLLYFDLRFYDGGAIMRLNEWGAKLRCALFGNPFGDQCLCIPAPLFEAMGGYDEAAPFGEDNLFVLRARLEYHAHLRRVEGEASTSARAYERHGWRKLIFRYQQIWFSQYLQARKGKHNGGS